MDDPRAQRTLVKSPPELWAEVSGAAALAGHLGAFGEIRITRLEPETTVAWEGDRARGTVELEPAGWGTRVTLTARIEHERASEEAARPEPSAAAQPEPDAAVEPGAVEPGSVEAGPVEPEREASALRHPARRRWRWWPFGRRRANVAAPAPEPTTDPAPDAPDAPEATKPAPESTAGPAPDAPEAAKPAPERADPPPDAPEVPEPEPEQRSEPESEPVPPAPRDGPIDAGRAEAILSGVLDDL